jgi:hypothetical protein
VLLQPIRSGQGCLETTENERIPGISTCVASSALADVDDRHVSGCRRHLRLVTSWLRKRSQMRGRRTLGKLPDRI